MRSREWEYELLEPAVKRRRPRGRLLLLVALAVASATAWYVASTRLPSQLDFANKWLATDAAKHAALRERRAQRVRKLNDELKVEYPPLDKYPPTKARELNYEALASLAACLEADTCDPGQDTVLILASYHFGDAKKGENGGEEIWAMSIFESARELNYTTLLAWGHMDALFMYQAIGDMVPMVMWEGQQITHCVERDDANYADFESWEKVHVPGDWQSSPRGCSLRPSYPYGIPQWKQFGWWFWDDNISPLGHTWTLAPEDYGKVQGKPDGNNTYLGYSIETECRAAPIRKKQHHAFVYGKSKGYFTEEKNAFSGLLIPARDSVPALPDGDPFRLVVTAESEGDVMPDEPGLVSMGRQPMDEWNNLLAESKVMVGVGNPLLSPSPYYALCLGVPFINPVLYWDHDNPDNRDKWMAQQNALKYVEEPYVYHVRAHDADALAHALQRAAATPIERYIPPPMLRKNTVARLKELVERDWQAEARERVAAGDAEEWMAMDEHEWA